LEEDYERKLRSKISQKFAKRNVKKIAPKMDKKNTDYSFVWPEPGTTAAGG